MAPRCAAPACAELLLVLMAVAGAGVASAAVSAASPKGQHADRPVTYTLDGGNVGNRYQSWLSPWQEGDDETKAPKSAPAEFRSTLPPRTRGEIAAQGAKGYGLVSVRKDMSAAKVEVTIAGIKASDIVMFHLHCGSPGVLGPILVDFSLIKGANFTEQFAKSNTFQTTITDDLIAATAAAGNTKTGNMKLDAINYLTMGCFVMQPTAGAQGAPKGPQKHSTVAGLVYIGNQGDLYFNIHTKYANYFGALRGQLEKMPPV